MKTYVIGDIHGMIHKLEKLLDILQPTHDDTLLFIGDYIDRGPDPKAVIDLLLRLIADGYRVLPLKGNHEEMLLDYLAGREDGVMWLYNGGRATLRSYATDQGRVVFPREHLDFLGDLLLFHETESHFFVHAGLLPNRDLENPDRNACLWIREPFLSSTYDWGKKIVFGHTPQRDGPLVHPNKIGIDTGAVFGGKLTCLCLPDETFVSA